MYHAKPAVRICVSARVVLKYFKSMFPTFLLYPVKNICMCYRVFERVKCEACKRHSIVSIRCNWSCNRSCGNWRPTAAGVPRVSGWQIADFSCASQAVGR